jgi:multicomponent Na+:H+ antiporter subunit E
MKRVVYILIFFGVWLLLTFNWTWQNYVLGMAVAVLTVVLFGKYFVDDVTKLFHPKRYFWFITYLIVFSLECLKANLDVAYRVLHVDLPIKPGIVKIKTKLKTAIAKTTLANSITMTPGTITVDIIDDTLYIHWIYVSTRDPVKYTEKIAGRFERYIKKIFE